MGPHSRLRLRLRSFARCRATPAEAAIVFLHLSSFAIRWTVPVPIPSDLATFKMPAPLKFSKGRRRR